MRGSAHLLALGCCALALLAAAPSARAADAEPPAAAPLGISISRSDYIHRLARLDPLTLRAQGANVVIPEFHDGFTFSPGRTMAAFTASTPPPPSAPPPRRRVGIRIVDLARMQVAADVQTGVAAGSLGWLARNRLVGLVQGGDIVVVDPAAGAVIARRSFRTDCIDPTADAQTRDALVMVLERRLVRVREDGRPRAVSLRGVPAECNRAGLAVDRSRERAYVVSGGPAVEVVDLRAMRVAHRRATRPSRAVVESTSALWLGRGRIAAAHVGRRGVPRGVELIDTRRWRRRTIDSGAGGVRLAAGTLLTFDPRPLVLPARARGLGAFRSDGRLRYRVLRRERIFDVQVAGRYAYARSPGEVHVVHVPSGKVVRSSPLPSEDGVLLLSPR